MKKSKKFFVRELLKFGKKYLPAFIYSYILFIRTYKKFKREISKEKTNIKYSQNLDQINDYEYKYTSQNNEDGIINYIFSKIPNNKLFVEIGFSYYECNSLNLIKNGWNGKLIDINKEECLSIKRLISFFYPKSKIQVINKKILKENINNIVFSGLEKNTLDFFSLDIDGNDYWVLKELNTEKINVLCCEYNHYLGNNVKKTIPYNPDHQWKNNGCFGASLNAISELLDKKGFYLIGVESSGTNAFFIKKNLAKNFEILSAEKSWKTSDRNNSKEQIKIIKESVRKFNFYEF
tara:strand:+ start:5178 stop:6053 length:876 start_codon:yes stop_codon:yes gene_type:complete